MVRLEAAATPSVDRWALVALILGAVGIGFAPIFVRLAGAGGVEPVASAFWRLGLAVPLLAPVWLAGRRGPLRPGAGLPWAPLIASGLFFAADLGLWHWAITLTTVANATLLANLNTVFVALIGVLVLQERYGVRFWVGLVAAFAGVLLLVGGSAQAGGGRLLGDGLGVATACMYAGYFLTVRAARRGFSTLDALMGSSLVTALALFPVAVLLGEQLRPDSLAGWGPLIGLAAVSQLAGQGLIIYALKHLPAAFSAVTLLLQPLVAALVAWGLFGERLSLLELAGGVAVLAGILLARLGSRTG